MNMELHRNSIPGNIGASIDAWWPITSYWLFHFHAQLFRGKSFVSLWHSVDRSANVYTGWHCERTQSALVVSESIWHQICWSINVWHGLRGTQNVGLIFYDGILLYPPVFITWYVTDIMCLLTEMHVEGGF